ncbi:MAG TPA: PilZ domain-containing protein [Polyangia bacterium]|nr:PilZ domain-containing protein [Polyangia bacterium]
MKQSRRVSPRIPYDEAVCLARVDGRGRLFGRSIDLGPAGLYVTCGELCEIGTEVVCAVPLPGGPRRLRGRVVRLVALPNAVGIAVAFTEIKEADRVLIERLVESRRGGAEPVRLRLDGLDHELRCEAIVDERTMRVSTALPPFLRLESGVGVVRGVAVPEARGVISRIAVDPNTSDGVPRLAVDVELDDELDVEGANAPEARRTPPSALPRPYRPPLPSVLLSERFAIDLVADAAVPLAPPPPRRVARTAELALRFMDRLTSPPSFAEEDLTRKTSARPTMRVARVPAAAWLVVPFLLAAIAILLVARPPH